MFYIDDAAYAVFVWVASWVGFLSLATYGLMQLIQFLLLNVAPKQNLKKKYGATWGLVTGSSSGIGKALAVKLAEQGINVVLVALDDAAHAATYAELQKKFPSVEFRKIDVDLSRVTRDGRGEEGYMKEIVAGTADIPVSLIFNNAGFMISGLFADVDMNKIAGNWECLATSSVYISHHFAREMKSEGRKGLIAFTSSCGGYFPGPTTTMYACSKAFLTNFAMTLAAEMSPFGVDVVSVQPSPVASHFFDKADKKLRYLKLVQMLAVTPELIADMFFSAAGRVVVWDQGLLCALFRIILKVIDPAFFAELFARRAHQQPDFQMLLARSQFKDRANK